MTNPEDALQLIQLRIDRLPDRERWATQHAANQIRQIVALYGDLGRLALSAVGAELQAERLRNTTPSGLIV